MARISPQLEAILKQFNLSKKDLWDCHGTLVMLHRTCEQIGATLNIEFLPPEILHNDTPKKEAVMLVTGKMGSRTEWSVGEATPYNNKNPYPWAMAEKRAKDRVILKLANLAGHVYTDIEADEFKEAAPVNHQPTDVSSNQDQADPPHILNIIEEFTEDLDGLEKLLKKKNYVTSRWTEITPDVAKKVLENADWARNEIAKLAA